jgi:hypothetical protein
MNELLLAGIRRGNEFSPNHIGNDAAIFQLTADHLRRLGCEVNEYIESDLLLDLPKEKAVFNMVRDWRSIRKLQKLEDRGWFVVNSGYGIENCTREKMTRLMIENDIPHPKSLIIHTADDPTEALSNCDFSNCWIKRGDFHAIHREDVTYVRNLEEAVGIIKEFALRDIHTVVVNEHLKGDLVKFYGVAGTDFFYRFYPSDISHSKFGLEVINGAAKGISFDEDKLRETCHRAAAVLGVEIYGGDCIIDEDGTARIIDFNDWPSFAPCRQEAAPYIAGRILKLYKDFLNKKS